MEIEIKNSKPNKETEEERKVRLYQVGNIIANKNCSFLILVVQHSYGAHSIVNLRTGDHISAPNIGTLREVADEYYKPDDVLVTKITLEVEVEDN